MYKQAFSKGSADGAFNLGNLYYYAVGVDQDLFKAAELYCKAADIGSPRAMIELGIMYECGSGVEKSYKEAFKWYKKANDLEYGSAYHIGVLYFDGDGVKKDYLQALTWFLLEPNNPKCGWYLGKIYQSGLANKKDISKAIDYYTLRADSQDDLCEFELGWIYETKDDFKSLDKAVEYYRRSSEHGNDYSTKALVRLGFSE